MSAALDSENVLKDVSEIHRLANFIAMRLGVTPIAAMIIALERGNCTKVGLETLRDALLLLADKIESGYIPIVDKASLDETIKATPGRWSTH